MTLQKGQKGDVLTALVKLEYIDRPLGESAKVDCSAEKPAEFNFNASVTVLFEDPTSLDDVAHRPVLCMYAFLLASLHCNCYGFQRCVGCRLNVVKYDVKYGGTKTRCPTRIKFEHYFFALHLINKF